MKRVVLLDKLRRDIFEQAMDLYNQFIVLFEAMSGLLVLKQQGVTHVVMTEEGIFPTESPCESCPAAGTEDCMMEEEPTRGERYMAAARRAVLRRKEELN